MELLKTKDFWITFFTLLVTLTFCHWLFGSGWGFVKGGISFKESVVDFKVEGVWVAIAGALAYGNSKRKTS